MPSQIPFYLDIIGKALDGDKKALIRWGDRETRWLEEEIKDVDVKSPIFVCGMARSGTTILTEALESHDDVVTHQYRDYPFIHIPYLWNKVRMFIPKTETKVERSHKDRIMVNAQSPDAMDEVLWASFDRKPSKAFEDFYVAHIKKLLLLRKGQRFLSKNNYNVTRIHCLKAMFPDAKFIIPIRSPEEVVASSLKQHKLFKREHVKDLRSFRYTKRLSHYEFGNNFRPINVGDMGVVTQEWGKGNEVGAYAHYWAKIHAYIEKEYKDDPQVKIVKYDELCDISEGVLSDIAGFCDLTFNKRALKDWSTVISAPQYYKSNFSKKEEEKIKKITQFVKNKLWSKKT